MKKSIFLLFALSIIMSSCDSEGSDTEPSTPPPAVINNIQLAANATFGNILTDAEGKSLYFFSKDTKDTSECNGGCEAQWPIFYKPNLALDAGLETADFGVITRVNGEKQNTYKGWPLYYFSGDNAIGDTNGDGVGENWYIAKPDYSLMYAQAQLVGRGDVNLKSDYTVGEALTFYMTSSKGRTVYTFSNDEKGTNKFTAADFSNDAVWPIFHVEIEKLPSILDANDFGTIDVFGRKQLTYKGRPLYYYGGDTERGDNFGVNVPRAGVWPIANKDTTPLGINEI